MHLKHDFINPERLLFLAQRTRARGDVAQRPSPEALEAFAHAEKVAETFRGQPDCAAPDGIVQRIREVIDRGTFAFLS